MDSYTHSSSVVATILYISVPTLLLLLSIFTCYFHQLRAMIAHLKIWGEARPIMTVNEELEGVEIIQSGGNLVLDLDVEAMNQSRSKQLETYKIEAHNVSQLSRLSLGSRPLSWDLSSRDLHDLVSNESRNSISSSVSNAVITVGRIAPPEYRLSIPESLII